MNPQRWLWGLIPVAVLAFLAVQSEHVRLEKDLGSRVEQRLRADGIRWARVGFSARDAVVTGRAPDETEQTKALYLVENVRGVRLAENRTDLVERVETYVWSAVRQGSSLRLQGMVPNEASRQAILSLGRTALPDVRIDDEMRLTRGVPSGETWMSGVSFALRQLQQLRSGSAKLEELRLSLTGEASSVESYRAVKAALAGDVPRGVRLVEDSVSAPTARPYTWTARHSGSQLALLGHYPSERAQSDILQSVRSLFPRARASDRMEPGSGAPAQFAGAVSESLKLLARLDEGAAELRDTTLTLTGVAPDDITAEAVRRSLRSAMPAGIRVSDAINVRETTPRVVRPYTTSAQIEDDRLVLTGFAPSEAARDALLATSRARFPGKRIDNRIEVAAGSADSWQRCLEAGLSSLARIGNGRTALTDRRIEVIASTTDEDLAEAAPLNLRSAAGSECEAISQVTWRQAPEPSLDWRASWSDRQVVLDGEVAGASAKAELAQIAQRIFPGATVTDRTRVVEQRSRRWFQTAERGLRALAVLERGEARLAGQSLTVSGTARDNPITVGLREQLARDIPAGYTVREQVVVATPAVPPPPAPPPVVRPPPVDPVARACEDNLRTVAREGVIRFDRADATLASDSFPTLDRLAEVARACPKVRIEIQGHTDSEGTPERNQKLSDRRAQAVVDYLVEKGVDAAKLNAVGFGETLPVAPNDSAENRARNRRIEFTVVE
jgi:outer membrane protein OmpA-like peptidoglycan-associated protein